MITFQDSFMPPKNSEDLLRDRNFDHLFCTVRKLKTQSDGFSTDRPLYSSPPLKTDAEGGEKIFS